MTESLEISKQKLTSINALGEMPTRNHLNPDMTTLTRMIHEPSDYGPEHGFVNGFFEGAEYRLYFH